MSHIRPIYSGYRGGFTSVGVCQKCQRTSLREDFHPAKVCPTCGASNKDRKWFSGKWVKPGPWWKFKPGYWELSSLELGPLGITAL